MTLPPEAQPIVDQLRALLGLPPCQIRIHIDDDGTVQAIQPLVTYRREKANFVDKGGDGARNERAELG